MIDKLCVSWTSTSTGEIVMNMILEMLLTFMFCMEDSVYGELV